VALSKAPGTKLFYIITLKIQIAKRTVIANGDHNAWTRQRKKQSSSSSRVNQGSFDEYLDRTGATDRIKMFHTLPPPLPQVIEFLGNVI
jgi:hypothetical protein